MTRFADIYSVSAEGVRALGSALEESGGSLEGAMSTLSGLERLRAALLTGDANIFASMGIAQGDAAAIIDAKDALQAYKLVADQMSMATPQQRINIANAAGLSEADMTLMNKGSGEISRLISKYSEIRPLTSQMARDAREFNNQLTEAKATLFSISDQVSEDVLPFFTNNLKALNELIAKNKGFVNENASMATGVATVAGATGLAGAAYAITQAGLVAAATAAATAAVTAVAMTAAAAAGYAAGTLISQNLSPETNTDIGRGITQIMALFGDEPSQKLLQAEGYNPQASRVPVIPTLNYDQPPGSPSFMTGLNSIPSRSKSVQPQNINVTLELDGTVIDRKIIKVVDGMAQTAIDDVASSNGG
jgi:hypothetical protein